MKEKPKKLLLLLLLCVNLCGCEKNQSFQLQEMEKTEVVEPTPEEKKETSEVCVYVCGSVNNPGVYMLKENARLYEAIDAAGGLCDDAAEETLNQARPIIDGERIFVPSTQDIENGIVDLETDSKQESSKDGKIDINTAGKEELMTLPGIGQSKAELILSYRNSKGRFSSIEELMEIEGIKEGVFNKIKDKIIVAK